MNEPADLKKAIRYGITGQAGMLIKKHREGTDKMVLGTSPVWPKQTNDFTFQISGSSKKRVEPDFCGINRIFSAEQAAILTGNNPSKESGIAENDGLFWILTINILAEGMR